jgi:hypothetical protein
MLVVCNLLNVCVAVLATVVNWHVLQVRMITVDGNNFVIGSLVSMVKVFSVATV